MLNVTLNIALGKEKYLFMNDNVIYYPVYIIEDDNVSNQIGIYELMHDKLELHLDEDGDLDITSIDGPLLYSFVDQKYLKQFEIKNEPLQETEDAEEPEGEEDEEDENVQDEDVQDEDVQDEDVEKSQEDVNDEDVNDEDKKILKKDDSSLTEENSAIARKNEVIMLKMKTIIGCKNI